MEPVIDALSWALLLAGSGFMIVSGLGVVRLPDLFTRMHGASIADTLGAGLILGGLMLQAGLSLIAVKLFLILVFLLFTSPVSAHALGNAAIRSGLASVEWPARFDVRVLEGQRELVIDGAHNPQAAGALAAAWRERYGDRVLTLNYESLVADPEATTRELAAFCDLEWRAECLDFHRRRDASFTFSELQVREPINASGIGRWRNYGEAMRPFIDALSAEGVDLDVST